MRVRNQVSAKPPALPQSSSSSRKKADTPVESPSPPRIEDTQSSQGETVPARQESAGDNREPQPKKFVATSDRPVTAPKLTTGMRDDLRTFFRIVIGRSRWTRVEFAQAAEKHAQNLGFDAAIDEINDWAFDRYGDSILKVEGQFIHVELPFL
ncbi:MAG: hypothetical protein O3A00_08845 [Planctomycetota bacterium]|nr:hypothetical protein [Planctomycetota bacterium]